MPTQVSRRSYDGESLIYLGWHRLIRALVKALTCCFVFLLRWDTIHIAARTKAK